MSSLNDAILEAHSQRDFVALVTLYQRASMETDDIDEACFFATQAYIFALDTGHPNLNELHQFLCAHNREE